MTEKQFTVYGKEIVQDDGCWAVAYSEYNADVIATALNELVEENEQLKSDNFNLNKTVECLDETVKEQCNKIAWADECGVRWNEEYNEWIGDVE